VRIIIEKLQNQAKHKEAQELRGGGVLEVV
jgi:hypothetical protein